jgi:hypothetical protein
MEVVREDDLRPRFEDILAEGLLLICDQSVLALDSTFELFVIVIVVIDCHIDVHCCLLLEELRGFANVWEVRSIHATCIGYIERFCSISFHFKLILKHVHLLNLHLKLCFLTNRDHIRLPHDLSGQ